MALAQRIITKCYILLLAIVLIGLFLRLYQLGTENVWVDEAIGITITKLSLPQLLQTQPQLDLNPPFTV